MKTENLPPSPETDDEVAALIATLCETERRLEELTGGEVDAVVGGSGLPFLLRRAQREMRNSEAAKQAAILNALPAHIALLDARGVIVSANEPWREFANENFLQCPQFGLGVNYLEICDRAAGTGSTEALRAAGGIRAVLAGAKSFSLEYPCHSPTEQSWFLMTVAPLFSSAARGAVVMHLNITGRKLADEARWASKQRLRDLIDGLGASMMVGLMTPDGILVEANAPALAAVGLRAEDVLGQPLVDLPWFAYSAEVRRQLSDAIARGLRGEASRYDMTIRGIGGRLIEVDFVLNPVRDESGKIVFLVPSGNVITERKQAETAMRESNEKFHQLADNVSDAFWIRSPDMSEVQYVSPAFEKIWGRTVQSLQANPHEWSEYIFAEDRARVVAAFAGLSRAAPSLAIEYRIVRPDGEIRWVHVRGSQVWKAEDQLIRHIGIVADITDRKQVETELQGKTALLEAQVAASIDGILVVDEQGRKALQNQRMSDLFNIPPEMANDPNDEAQLRWVSALTKDPARFAERVAHLNSHREEIGRDEIELKSGSTFDRYSAPVVGREGKYYGRIWTFRDITERKRSMEALRASEQCFKAVFDQVAIGVAQAEVTTGRFVQVNQRFADILGRSREEVEHLTFAAITHPRDVSFDLEMMRRFIEGTIREYAREKRYVRPDGSAVWVSLTVSAMWAPGEPPGLCIAVAQDITERKRLDEHFLQAQKMEALGQFSGGVAHDFNNILTGINGYAELARMSLVDNPDVREYLDAVLKSTGRATDLVKQILTFSRQQPQERQAIPLRRVVEESIKLLRATLPSTITFDTSVAADAPTVLANANQVHQVLTNLGVNAWHAMQDRPGCLQIKLEKWVVDEAQAAVEPRLRPGGYARVSVSDSGCGMDAATLRRIFEPFFTTKPVGQGTGLGLSVVHGIMDAHDGAVTVHSHPGEGTGFHLYFPAHEGETHVGAKAEGPTPRGKGEAVLVVDDEEMVASMIQQVLDRLGYTAEFATDPTAALALVHAAPAHFELVLSDMTMPGMTGLMLATRLREIRPDLPVILMTGFGASLTPELLEKAGVREVLFKPMTAQVLASAVQAALAARPPRPT